MDREMTVPGLPGEAVLRLPGGEITGGLVALHGASDGRARQPLFEHLAQVLDARGIAVLSYERRPNPDGGDTAFTVQAEDAVTAMRALEDELGCPVGVFGFSQGAWPAAIAASDDVASFLITLGCSGVSPAKQMRFYCDELLRRSGYSDDDRTQLSTLRLAAEDFLRGGGDRDAVQRLLTDASDKPWFQFAFLPPQVPPEGATWDDMDVDPAPSFAQVNVRVLAMWGADEECVPREASQQMWRASGASVDIVDLPGCGHWPVVGSGAVGYAGWDTDEVSEDFATALIGWNGYPA